MYQYDPYGNAVYALGSHATINPLRYRGYYYDNDTGLYYLQSRYYDPKIGRFINADSFASTGQGFIGYNMFAYCGNNPASYEDGSGCSRAPCTFALDDGSGGTVSLDKQAQIIAHQHTAITKRIVTKDGQDYTTYDVSVETNCFSDWKNDWRDMVDVAEYYSEYVYNQIQSEIASDGGAAYWIMSENHIYSEMMAHIEVWFTLGVDSTEEANLNVDEDRAHVRLLMYLHGYNGDEEVIYK